eukprot:727097-Amphidinium_carterae.1
MQRQAGEDLIPCSIAHDGPDLFMDVPQLQCRVSHYSLSGCKGAVKVAQSVTGGVVTKLTSWQKCKNSPKK